MKVDFNNLRAQAAFALDNLTAELNAGILKEQDGTPKFEISNQTDENGKDIWIRGNLLVDSNRIQNYMEELRSLVMTINAVYEPNDPEFQDNSELIERNGGCRRFNEEDEQG